ncbi:MAG: AI-2E family transporter [Chloroflexota bacterium]|nr:AI-2E family transporter [Chloroflexota bacterium]
MRNLLEIWLGIPRQRRKRLVLLLFAITILFGAVWAAREVLWPYFLGLFMAYLLDPSVDLLERSLQWTGKHRRLGFFKRAARPVAILLTYVLGIALLVGFFSLVVPLIGQQAQALWAEREVIWEYFAELVDNLIEQYRLLDPQIQTQVEDALGKFTTTLGKVVQQTVGGTAVAISYTVSLLLAILVIPFWTFYLLKDSAELAEASLRTIPVQIRADLQKMVFLANSVLSAYLRGQLFLALIIGGTSALGYSLLGVRFALLLGLLAAVFEMLPNIGPVLTGIVSTLIALMQDPVLALWTALFAVGVQQVENLFLTPRVLGRSVKLHPVLIMVVLVIGSELGGLLGLFLAPVITAVLRDLFRYLYYRFGDRPASPAEALQLVLAGEKFELVL